MRQRELAQRSWPRLRMPSTERCRRHAHLCFQRQSTSSSLWMPSPPTALTSTVSLSAVVEGAELHAIVVHRGDLPATTLTLVRSPRAGRQQRAVDASLQGEGGAEDEDSLGKIGTSSPVLGLRPTRCAFCRTTKLPNEEIFIISPRANASDISSRMDSTRAADSFLDRPTSWLTASFRCARVIVCSLMAAYLRRDLVSG